MRPYYFPEQLRGSLTYPSRTWLKARYVAHPMAQWPCKIGCTSKMTSSHEGRRHKDIRGPRDRQEPTYVLELDIRCSVCQLSITMRSPTLTVGFCASLVDTALPPGSKWHICVPKKTLPSNLLVFDNVTNGS